MIHIVCVILHAKIVYEVVGFGLDHKAEFLGIEGQILCLGIGFSLFLGLGISRPMTRPWACKNVSFRIRKD